MAKKEENIANDIASRRGIYFPAFSIYNELGGFYDYGPIGVRIRRNIEQLWRRIIVEGLGALEVETTTTAPEVVFKASGHLAAFTDPIVKCAVCNTPYRADKLLEEYYYGKGDEKSAEEVKKLDLKELEKRISEHGIRCSKCAGKLSKVEKFNLMFKTSVGAGEGEVAYLRPETAQGIFVDFKMLSKTHSMKMPVAIAQSGKSYRNEISPRQRLTRMREFTQMEVEFFFDPEESVENVNGIEIEDILRSRIPFLSRGSERAEEASLGDLVKSGRVPNKPLALLLHLEDRFLRELGLDPSRYRFREVEKEELPHYSRGNVDIEANTSYGYIELAGNAYRTDYDLKSHASMSNTEISVMNNGRKLVPHVVESSMGLDRIFLALLDNSAEQGKERGWPWLRLNEKIAPYKYAILPLQRDEQLVKLAREVYGKLSEHGASRYYSETGSIGKRYARADEIGVPYCLTIDFQTLDDGTFTVRNRDTTKQERKTIDDLL